MAAMAPSEWEHLVQRLNGNYPGQQINPLTTAEWYEPLSSFPNAEVWAAIDRHRRDLTPGRDGIPAGHWAPSLAGILACIDANWRDASAARRELEARAARAERNGHGGARMPPETKQALEILKAAKASPGSPGHIPGPVASQRIEALADQLDERIARKELGQLP